MSQTLYKKLRTVHDENVHVSGLCPRDQVIKVKTLHLGFGLHAPHDHIRQGILLQFRFNILTLSFQRRKLFTSYFTHIEWIWM